MHALLCVVSEFIDKDWVEKDLLGYICNLLKLVYCYITSQVNANYLPSHCMAFNDNQKQYYSLVTKYKSQVRHLRHM